MDLYTLFNNAVTAVAGDGDLETYSLIKYGRVHSVKTNPPADGLSESDCPMLIIHSPKKDAKQSRRDVVYGFSAEIIITEPDLATRAEDNVQESEGTEIILAMFQYVKEAVRGVLPTNWNFSYSLDSDAMSLFPLMVAGIYFEFVEQLTIGSGDPTA